MLSVLCSQKAGMRKITFIFISLFLAGCSGEGTETDTLIEGRNIITANGMVVSAHPEASRIGAGILRRGGNATDAAIAVEFALAVCYPEAGNIGGGGFMLIRTHEGETDVIDYREKAPSLAHRDMFLDNSGNVTPGLSTNTPLASGVPGTVDGMVNAHSRYGSLPLNELIQPAIDMAENGFSLTGRQADDLNSYRENFIGRNSNPIAFVKDSPWKAGDLLIQKDLAGTLKRIRDLGRAGFYSGKTSELITASMKRGNGLISEKDLSEYRSVSRKPLEADYRGFSIITVPPPSSGGIILLQLLGMSEPFPLEDWGFNSIRTVHLIAEAERRAFADRSEYPGDPDLTNVPVSMLLNKNYLAGRMNNFNETKASLSTEILPGTPAAYSSEETTHYSVVDALGNAVSATTTLNDTFGSSIVVDGAGFLLNNQMDDFSIKPGFPNMYGLVGGEANSIAPGKKMLSSMTPVIVEKDGKLILVAGSPGGSTIPTTVYQIIINIIDHGMSVGEAVDTGRFHHQWLPDRISFEKSRFDSTAAARLYEMGHQLAERASIGRVSAILILDDGRKAGGADRRGDNISCGY